MKNKKLQKKTTVRVKLKNEKREKQHKLVNWQTKKIEKKKLKTNNQNWLNKKLKSKKQKPKLVKSQTKKLKSKKTKSENKNGYLVLPLGFRTPSFSK